MFMYALDSGQPGTWFLVLALAFLLDAAFGDPPLVHGRDRHPVAVLGRFAAFLEARFKVWAGGAGDHRARLLAGGVLTTLAVLVVAGGAGWLVSRACGLLPAGWLFEALAVSVLLSYRGLAAHVRGVAAGLEASLGLGRRRVAEIVGRDPERLDADGVARAAVESLAENFSDGTVAPLFWAAVFGLPGIAIYKAANTLDSMVGHRGGANLWFGRVPARLDDALSYVPARLSVGLVALAALGMRGARAGAALRVAWRDASGHASVNAGWPEGAFAGALGLRLGGGRWYGGGHVAGPWIGDGPCAFTPRDIRRALALYWAAGVVVCGVLAALAALAGGVAWG